MKRLRLDNRQRQAADPQSSAWVSANAGAGKTQVLSNRIARLLLAGAEPANILCLTYTKAGAAEMADRIHSNLSDWTALDDKALETVLHDIGVMHASPADLKRARQLFALALDTPGGFKIQTIHGFCERILQLFPVEARMAPGFEILDDAQRKEILDHAREEVLSAAKAQAGGELSAALELVGQYTSPDNLRGLIDEMLSNAALSGGNTSNSHGGLIDDQLRRFFGLDQLTELKSIRDQLYAFDDDSLLGLANELIATKSSRNCERGEALNAFCHEKDAERRAATIKDMLFLGSNGKLREPPTVTKGKLKDDVFERLQNQLTETYDRLKVILQQHDALVRIEATKALALIASEVIARFREAKARRAAYDFDDLIERTRLLLTDQAAAAWVLYKLDKAVTHVLVDEAQDTSPPQWQIIQALTEEFLAGIGQPETVERTIFVVGDQKQSIFSFQGANVRIFAEARTYFTGRSAAALQRMADVPLTVSYRSLNAVLQAVDSVFKIGMPARQALGIADQADLVHEPSRREQQGIVELWPLVNAEEAEVFDKWRAPRQVREQTSPHLKLARQIAATIASWIGRRRLAGDTRAIRPDDILLLFRSRNTMFDLMITALREAGVPVAGADRLVPAENIAVEDMLALIRVMSLPQDDYALACLLKSPLVSQPLSEEQLFALAHGRGEQTLWQRLAGNDNAAARAAIAELEGWQMLARECRPYEFITRVLTARRPHILARLGGEAADALKAMCEEALGYEREHAASLAGFAAWFRAETSEIKRDMDKGQGEVRLMTVHGAKGLEAGIVFLPDAASFNERDRERLLFVSAQGGAGDVPLWKISSAARLVPSPAIDAMKSEVQTASHSEYTRLLYVAMTRARDELYICGASDKKNLSDNSWHAMVKAALVVDGKTPQVESDFAGPVWRWGDEPDWQLPDEQKQNRDQAVDVPACLLEPYLKRKVYQAPVVPSRLAHGHARVHDAKAAKAGRVLHRILERLPDLREEDRRSHAEKQLRKAGLDVTLADRLLQAVQQPELKPLFAPGSGAEVNIATRLPNGQLLPGIIDRLAVREHDVLLIDYKSDAIVPDSFGATHPYGQQLIAYCFALQKLYPGKPVKAGILWLSTLRLDWLETADIDASLAALHGGDGVSVT